VSEEYTPVDTGDSGWGTTFHRHFASSDIHRDDRTCERGGKRQVYVFDPDHLLAHDAEIARRAAVKALREAAEATSDEDSIIDIALGGAAFVGDWLRALTAALGGGDE